MILMRINNIECSFSEVTPIRLIVEDEGTIQLYLPTETEGVIEGDYREKRKLGGATMTPKKPIVSMGAPLSRNKGAHTKPLTSTERIPADQLTEDMVFAKRDVYTLNDAFDLWRYSKRGTIKSFAQEEKRLSNHIFDKLGHIPLEELDVRDIVNQVRPLADEDKISTLKVIVMRLRAIMDMAVAAGYVSKNVVPAVTKLFKPKKAQPMPSLPWQDMPVILENFKRAPMKIRILFLGILATMCRTGEVLSLRWEWINWTTKTITIPAEFTKMNRVFTIPISSFFERLIKIAESLNSKNSEQIFALGRDNTDSYRQAVAKWMNHDEFFKGRLVPHGVRAMGRTWLADHEVDHYVAEMCLNHEEGINAANSYLRTDYLELRRPLMEQWGNYILESMGELLPEQPFTDDEKNKIFKELYEHRKKTDKARKATNGEPFAVHSRAKQVINSKNRTIRKLGNR